MSMLRKAAAPLLLRKAKLAATAFTWKRGQASLTAILVGTKSVGKSTLYNALVGEKLAIVDATPGTTRDWKQGRGRLGNLHFNIIDTPGIDPAVGGPGEVRHLIDWIRVWRRA